MSVNEVDTPGTVLFDASNNTLTHDEIWDDTLLIQHYDNAMAKVDRKLRLRSSATESELSEAGSTTRRGGGATGGGGGATGGGGGATGRVGGRKGHAEGMDNSHIQKKKKKKSKTKVDWQVGDFCRAQYPSDKMWYEATVTSVPPDLDPPRCWVRFLGYGDTQEVPLNTLRRSLGEAARRTQIEEMETASESEVGSSVAESDRHSDTDGERSSKRQKPPHPPPPFYSHHPRNNTSHHHHHHRSQQHQPPPMLPPNMPAAGPLAASSQLPVMPPPPALTRDLSGDPEASEALHTMLMSWYMTGYHTGYYQGLSQARNARVKH